MLKTADKKVKGSPTSLKTRISTPPEDENLDPDAGKSRQQVIDEITGQLRLFGDDDPQE